MTEICAITHCPPQACDQLAGELAPARFAQTVIRRRRTTGPAHHAAGRRTGGPLRRAGFGRGSGRVLRFCHERGLTLFVLGRGSNLLVRDGGFRGVVICLAHPHFSRIEVAANA